MANARIHLAAIATVIAFLPAVASAQAQIESRSDATKQRCSRVVAGIGQSVSSENAARLRELRDCDQSSAPLVARLWASRIDDASVLNALIRASTDVYDVRIAAAALAVVENESRAGYERAAALTILANYLVPSYVGNAEKIGSQIHVQLVARSHATRIPGSQPPAETHLTRIIDLISSLREPGTPREMRDIALLARLPNEK